MPIDPFLANAPILYPLKTTEILWFFDVLKVGAKISLVGPNENLDLFD